MPAEPLFPPIAVPADQKLELMQDMLDVAKLAGEVFDLLEKGMVTPPVAKRLHDMAARTNRVRAVLQSAVVAQLPPSRHVSGS